MSKRCFGKNSRRGTNFICYGRGKADTENGSLDDMLQEWHGKIYFIGHTKEIGICFKNHKGISKEEN